MSDYDNRTLSSDLDAYKHSAVIRTGSFTFSGNLNSGASTSRETSLLAVDTPDFGQVLFDNSVQHSGKFKNLALEEGKTAVIDTVSGTPYLVDITMKVTSTGVQLFGTIFNPTVSALDMQSTTINFRYVPYETTF